MVGVEKDKNENKREGDAKKEMREKRKGRKKIEKRVLHF